MLIYNLLNFIFGYTLVSVEKGEHCKKLMSYLVSCKVQFRDVKNTDSRTVFRIKFCYKKFILNYCHQNVIPADAVTLFDIGLPFVIMRYKLRIGMAAGIFMGAALIVLSTFFVWKIDIEGNARLNYTQIADMLNREGFCEGAFLPAINLKRIETAVMMKNKDVAFISIYMKGTNAIVQINERVIATDKEDLTLPRNLVASHSGQIMKLEVVSGECVVKRGQAVEKGQLLVSGIVDSNTVGYRIKSASGKILASTTHDLEYKIPLKQSKKHYTGREIKHKSIKILGKYINFFINSGNLYDKYDTIYNEDVITLFGSLELPLYYAVTTYSEYNERVEDIPTERARELAYDKYAEFISSRKDIAIENEQLTEKVENGFFILSGTIECIEDIAEEKNFYYNQEPVIQNDGTNNNI